MSTGATRPSGRAALWTLAIVVLLVGFGSGPFTGRVSFFGLLILVTVGALLAGYSSRDSTPRAVASGALIAAPLALLALSGFGGGGGAEDWLGSVGFALVVVLIYAAIGWYLAGADRTATELTLGIAAAVVLGVPIALIGIIGLFALACEGGC